MGNRMVKSLYDEHGQLISRTQQDAWSRWDPKRGYKFNHNRRTVETAVNIPFPVDVDHADIGRMAVLSRHLVGDSGMLGVRTHRGVRPMDISDIYQMLGIRRTAAYDFVRRMVDVTMLACVDVESGKKSYRQFYVNPLYFAASDWIPLGLYLLFREQIDEHLPNWAIDKYKLAELAVDDA